MNRARTAGSFGYLGASSGQGGASHLVPFSAFCTPIGVQTESTHAIGSFSPIESIRAGALAVVHSVSVWLLDLVKVNEAHMRELRRHCVRPTRNIPFIDTAMWWSVDTERKSGGALGQGMFWRERVTL